MTSKIIVNTIEADTGISSVTFASNINLQNDSSILVSSSGVRLGTGSTIAAPSANELALSTNSAERFRIDSNGNIGIGVNNPSSFNSDGRNLVVGTGSGGQGISIYSANNSYGTIYFADGTSGSELYRGGLLYNHASDFLRFDTAGAERLRINSAGEVYIGSTTANGQGKLFVNDSSGATTTRVHIRNAVSTGNAETYYNLDGTKFASVGLEDGALVFRNSTSSTPAERLRIRSDGKISAGTAINTTNTYEFSVTGADGTGGFYAHGRNHYLSNRSNAYSSLTLKKANADSDGIDYLQLRDSSNTLKGQITGAGNWKPISGGGIDFSANSSHSGMTSELLDDYEEGSSTVSIQHITADTNQVYMTYTKIGSVVCVVGVITITNKTASSGTNGWFHLPFAPSAHNTARPGCDIQMNTINTNVAYLGFYGNNTNCYFMSRSGGYQDGNSLGNGKIGFTATYTTH